MSIAAKSEKTPESVTGFGGLPGKTEFGRAGRRSIRNAVGALARRFGTKVLFGTLTLPGSTPKAIEALARQSGRAVQLLLHWIASVDKQAYVTYVWEWQKRGALHLHFAVGAENVLTLRRLERQFRSYVHTLFETLSRHAGVDMFEREDGGTWRGQVRALRSRIEVIRKSVKAYMAKYLTKGEAVEQTSFPSRWWGMSRALRALVCEYRTYTVFRVSDWGCLSQIAERTVQALRQCKVVLFGYSAKFNPSIRTWLIYAPDAEVDNTYESILLLISHLEATCTGIYEPASYRIKPGMPFRSGLRLTPETGELCPYPLLD